MRFLKRLAVLAFALAATGDGTLLAQRGGAVPQDRQSGAAPQGGQGASPQPGRQGGAAPTGRQGGTPGAGRQGAPARPARDRAAAEGTAVIRGRIVTADTGTPVRRAEVQATIGGQRARGALTDTEGRFELRDLPAGSYTIRVSKTGFVTQQFGQRSPFSPADPQTLADGQRFTADFALLRGGAITGRVFDDLGDPVANVRVTALRAQLTANGRRMISLNGPVMTDDTGAYRVFGLAPGSYYVSAAPQGALAVNGATLPSAGAVTYGPTYFPGTTDAGSAQRVAITAGQEQPNIDLALTATPAVRVSGVVIGLNGAPIQAMVNLLGSVLGEATGVERRGVNSSPDGSFMLPNVSPGNYLLEVTGRTTSREATPEVASIPLAVGTSDITGLNVTTSRGATIDGTVAAENRGSLDTSGIRVTAPPMRTVPGGYTPRAQVTNTGAFELAGLIGPRTVRFEQLPSGWVVKSITANGVDVTDVPLDFRGTEQVSLRVILTDRVTEVSGTVRAETSPRGAGILVFADNRARWIPTSRYLRTARAGDSGQFTLRALPGNERYLAVALEYIETGEHLDPEFLERVKPLATSFSLAEGEQKRLELTLQSRP